ncbi:hypothetical protein [Litchfieldia alkalitelluris]|uniref:hypothetical protein n=1 Tax=Litchfieldia alkalitelluris TaxID=304268 RepID=UPI0009983468|nr:hypothetical protein [Litchfieldia alkalitelluris]
MKNRMLLAFSLVFICFLISGCQLKDSSNLEDEGIFKVSISPSIGFGNVNTDFFAEFNDEHNLEIFNNIISNAVLEKGIVNMAEPEFDIEITFSNGNKQGYHLWVSENGQQSTLMKIENTHIIYSIPKEMTNQLIPIVK